MKKEYLDYAKRLKTIGELIEKISHVNDNGQNESKEIRLAIQGYEYTLDSVKNIKAPNIVTNEHSNLISSLTEWINVIREANQFGITSETRGAYLANLKMCEAKVIQATDSIVNKLKD